MMLEEIRKYHNIKGFLRALTLGRNDILAGES